MSNEDIARAVEVNRTPDPAPLPADNPGKHATDSQGVRKLDAEDIKSHGLDPATTKKKGKTFPRSATSSSISQDTPVNDLRRVACMLPQRDVRHSSLNFFIPSFGMMFALLDVMNDKVCTLRSHADNGSVNAWIPQVSYIVFSLLAYVQVFRAQQLLNMLDAAQVMFLDQFLAAFPLERLEIPGPLVPFFRSLSVSSPGFGNYMDVFPAVPVLTMSEQTLYSMQFSPPENDAYFNGLNMMLPNFPLMMDQFVNLIQYLLSDTVEQPRKYSTYNQLSSIFGIAYNTTDAALQPHVARHLKSLGFWHRPTASDKLMSRFAHYIRNATTYFPPPPSYNPEHAPVAADPEADPPIAARAARWDAIDVPHEFFMMSHDKSWFSILLRGMTDFNRHWKGNQSLLSISPTQSTAGMILFKQVRLAPIAPPTVFTASVLNRASHRLEYDSSAHTTCPYIVNEDFQDAQIAQVNIECPAAVNNDMWIGKVGTTRFGDFWSVTPDVFETDRGNLTPELQSMTGSLVFFQEKSS